MTRHGKKHRISLTLSGDVLTLLRAGVGSASRKISISKMIEWCVRKALLNREKSIKEKIAEHQRKTEYWKQVLKDYIEVKGK